MRLSREGERNYAHCCHHCGGRLYDEEQAAASFGESEVCVACTEKNLEALIERVEVLAVACSLYDEIIKDRDRVIALLKEEGEHGNKAQK